MKMRLLKFLKKIVKLKKEIVKKSWSKISGSVILLLKCGLLKLGSTYYLYLYRLNSEKESV